MQKITLHPFTSHQHPSSIHSESHGIGGELLVIKRLPHLIDINLLLLFLARIIIIRHSLLLVGFEG